MSEEHLESTVYHFLRSNNMPLMGIARVQPLPNLPEAYSPQTILKGAKSFICYGAPIPKGIVYAERDAIWLWWRYWAMTYRSLDTIAHNLCLMLEERGERAVPAYG